MPLDELSAHLVGQKGMLVIGRVVDAGRQHGDDGLALAGRRRAGRQRPAQHLGIIGDRPYTDLREQLRKHLQHRFPVLQHVGDTGRRAGIVLQHEELVLAGAYEIHPDDVGEDPAGRRDAQHLWQEGVVVLDQRRRHAACPQDFLAVIDIVQEGVDRAHALLDALGEPRPLLGRDDARHDVERDQPLVGVRRAIDVEGDAGTPEEALRLPGLAPQALGRLARKPVTIPGVRRARPFAAPVHLIEKRRSFSHAGHLTGDSRLLNGLRLRGTVGATLPHHRANHQKVCPKMWQHLKARPERAARRSESRRRPPPQRSS